MTIKGFPSSQKLPLGTGITNEFATVVPTDEYRNSLDVNRPLFRVTTIKTAAANTGNIDGVTWVYDTSTPAKKGDIVRFETGNAQYIETPIVKVETNRFLLGAYLASAPASGDTFYILRSVSPRVDATGTASVTATSSPIQFKKDAVDTFVSTNTTTPSNSIPLPVAQLNTNGTVFDPGTLAKAAQLPTTLGQTTSANSISVVLASDQSPVSTMAGQTTASGAITTSSSVAISTIGMGTVGFQVTGTWVGTIVVEGTVDGTNYLPTTYVALASGGTSGSFTANTIGQINSTGLVSIRLRGATLSSGSAVVSFRASDGNATVMLDNPLPSGSNTIGAVSQSGTWNITALTSITNALPTGTNSIGNIGTVGAVTAITNALPTGTNSIGNIGTVGAVTAITNALPTGTNNIGSITNVTGTLPASLGRAKVNQLFNDYSVTPVTTAAYVQLIASTAAVTNKLEIFDSSGEVMILAVGAAASEVDQLYILPGGNGPVDLAIPSGSRISIKAKTATASVGLVAINLYS